MPVPFENDPHYRFTIDWRPFRRLPDDSLAKWVLAIAAVEDAVPGALAYATVRGEWKWHRLTKLDDEKSEPVENVPNPREWDEVFVLVQVHGAWLADAALRRLRLPWRREARNGAAAIKPYTETDGPRLEARGRELVAAAISRGALKAFVADFANGYQFREVGWSSERPWSLSVMSPGAGKTLASIMTIATHPGPAVVVAPAAARTDVWPQEFVEYSDIEPFDLKSPGERRSKDETLERYLARVPQPVVLVGMELLADRRDELAVVQPSMLVVDEIHELGLWKRWTVRPNQDGGVDIERRKTRTGTRDNRAVAIMDVSRFPSIVFRQGLSATPLEDAKMRRMWAQLDTITAGGFGFGRAPFVRRHCRPDGPPSEHTDLDDSGCSNLQELKRRCSYFLHRVPYEESHRQLIEKGLRTRLQVVRLPPSLQSRPDAMARELKAAEKAALARPDDEETTQAFVECILQDATSRKRGWLMREVTEGVRQRGKVVLFGTRHKHVEQWASWLAEHVDAEVRWAHGGASEDIADVAARMSSGDIVRWFRDHDGPAVAVGTGFYLGQSLNGWEQADLALFGSLPWKAAQFAQWRGRFDRLPGRGRPSKATLLKVPIAVGTREEVIATRLAKGFRTIREFLDAVELVGVDDDLLGIGDRAAVSRMTLDALGLT